MASTEALTTLKELRAAAQLRHDDAVARRDEAEREREDAAREIAALSPAIALLEGHLGQGPDVDEAQPPANHTIEFPLDGPWRGLPTYKGKPRLPSVIVRVLQDGRRLGAEAIIDIINTTAPFSEDPPVRASVLNRLNDLANEGVLQKFHDGTYQLASASNAVGTPQPLGLAEGVQV